MIKLVKPLVLFFLLLSTTQVFADKKKIVNPTLEGDAKIEFDYTFMEGVRYKMLGDLKSAMGYFDRCMNMYDRSAAVRYEVATILTLGDDLTLPLQLMREAVELEPTNIWYNLFLANILQKKSMMEEACKIYDGLIQLHPEREDFYIIETDLYTSVEKWEQAIDVLNKYEKQFGISESSTIEKAKLYSKLKNLKKSSNELLKLVKKYPEKTDYLGLLAELYLVNGQEKKGLQLLDNIMKSDPKNAFVRFYLSDYYRSKNDTLRADHYLQNVLLNDHVDNGLKVQYLLKLLMDREKFQISPDRLYSYVQILLNKYNDDLSIRTLNADFLRQANKLKECKEELEFVLSKEKNNYLIWEELMVLSNQLGDTAAMYREGRECLRYFPIEPLPYVMISLPLISQSKYEEAIIYLKQGLAMASENSPVKAQLYAYLGDCYYQQDSVKLAFEMFDSTLKINPLDVLTLNNYSYYLSVREERLDQAEKMIATAISADPNNSTFLDTYAWVLFKRKNYSLAKFYMRSAIENIEEPDGVLYEHFGDILFMNGDREEAIQMWNKALTLDEKRKNELKNRIENGLPVEHEK